MQFTAIVRGCAGIRELSSKTLRVMQLTTVLLLGFCLQTAPQAFRKPLPIPEKMSRLKSICCYQTANGLLREL